MIDSFDVRPSNERDLIADLKRFREEISVRAAKRATKVVAEYLQRMIVAAAPVFTGKLRFNIFVRAQYVKRRGVVRSTVAVRTVGKADNPRNAFYWRFIEWGHKTRPKKGTKRTRTAGVLSPGQKFVKGEHFILNTYSAAQTAAQRIFFQSLERSIARLGLKTSYLR